MLAALLHIAESTYSDRFFLKAHIDGRTQLKRTDWPLASQRIDKATRLAAQTANLATRPDWR